MTVQEAFTKIEAILEHHPGQVVLLRSNAREDQYMGAFEFGREAPDSPMVGGAAYAVEPTLEEVIIRIGEQL